MANIRVLNPNTFEYQEYSESDIQLIPQNEFDTVFSSSTDYVEYTVFDQNQNKIFPEYTYEFGQFSILSGDVSLEPIRNLEDIGYTEGRFITQYNFYRKHLLSSPTITYYITEISNDRTEIRIKSNVLPADDIIASTNTFIQYRNNRDYFVDFLLNFGDNETAIANNIQLVDDIANDPSVLIKLYEPLPAEFNLKTQLWVVEQISDPQVYEVEFEEIPIEVQDFEFIQGPNFCIDITQQIGQASEKVTYNTLLSTPMTSSNQQLQSLLEEKGITVNIDFTDYENFVKFSTAKTRLDNFIYKAGLIESSSLQLNDVSASLSSASRAQLQTTIDVTIRNLDPYEYWLYYDKNDLAYPKTGSKLVSTGSDAYLAWYGSEDENNIYYGGIVTSASIYDRDNQDRLYYSIPEYLLEDPDNEPYEIFIDMVAQHFDNVWVYTKDVANRFDGDNRLDYGISKDLVADAIRDFGVKLYSNNFATQDLYLAFLGTTVSGSEFPILNITGSNPQTGDELITNQITSSAQTDPIPLNDTNQRLYKRLYHNIPYLLKSKGTLSGLKALITTFGIPSTILDAREYGGSIRSRNARDNIKTVYNYYPNLSSSSTITTPWAVNEAWSASRFDTVTASAIVDQGVSQSILTTGSDFQNIPSAIEFRLKPEGAEPSNLTSSIFSIYHPSGSPELLLQWSGSSVTSSYSGSIRDLNYNYGTLTFYPNGTASSATAEINLPFYNGDWWGVMLNYTPYSDSSTDAIHTFGTPPTSSTYAIPNYNSGSWTLTAANKSSDFQSTQQIAFKSTASITSAGTNYQEGSSITFGNNTFSGSIQEIRYYRRTKLQDSFNDFVLNPYSYEGVGPTGSLDDLIFRLPLGNNLYTSSLSIHPKISGSLVTQSSFELHSSASITSISYTSSTEIIAQNQIPFGLKTQTSDQIAVEGFTPYDTRNDLLLDDKGFVIIDDPVLTIKVDDINQGDGSVLSSYRTLQQDDHLSLRDTDNRYLEVGFSPSDQINDDIVAQMGYFNIGEYIGDVRDVYDVDSNSYPKLDRLRDSYFSKYVKSYDVRAFIRLIKYFDNSLFKMIKDFTPANVSLSSGVIIKQHLLERNRHKAVRVNVEDLQLTSSIGNPRIERFSGGTGGSMQIYQDSASLFPITQSWDEIVQTLAGAVKVTHNDEEEFYTGELQGTVIDAITGTGAVDCSRFTNPSYNDVLVKPIFVSTAEYTEETFLLAATTPPEGVVWFWHDGSNVQHIKVHNTSRNSANLTNILPQLTSLPIFLNEPSVTPPPTLNNRPSGVYNWIIEETVIFDNYVYYRPAVAESPDIVYSQDVNRVNFNLNATGDFVWRSIDTNSSVSLLNAVKATGDINSIPQGFFPITSTYPREQFFRGWGDATYITQSYNNYTTASGEVSDPGGNFDTGDREISNGHLDTFNALAPLPREPWFMDVPQLLTNSGSSAVHDGATERERDVVAILLGPRIADGVTVCSSPDINTYNTLIAVEYTPNSNIFTLSGGRYRMLPGSNGTNYVKDITLRNPGSSSAISWDTRSIINVGSANITLAYGNYPVFRSSVLSNDTIIITIGDVNGAPGITNIYYCPV